MNHFNYKLLIFGLLLSCSPSQPKGEYQTDLDLIQQQAEVIELVGNHGEARIAIVPKFQGKILTSTFSGLKGLSNGWLNHDAFNQNTTGANVGGEDRLWIGPLGSQFSFYYQQIKPLDEQNWLVPTTMNDEPYLVTHQSNQSVTMSKEMNLTNFIGTSFSIKVTREIRLLTNPEVQKILSIDAGTIKCVAYESKNMLINKGDQPWIKESGLPSIWNLGMLKGSDQGYCIIPLKSGKSLDPVNTYLSKIDSSRLTVTPSYAVYRTDGKYRNKIGVPTSECTSLFGSYHPETHLLTIMQFDLENDSLYFNSDVSVQQNPYQGEPIQIYNNGSMDFKPMANNTFYEMETSSPQKETLPGDSICHIHRIFHFTGDIAQLNLISKQLLSFDLLSIKY